jgi:chemotaxis protein MotB
MKKSGLLVLVMIMGLIGCASTKECEKKLSAVEMQKQQDEAQLQKESMEAKRAEELARANQRLSQELQDEMRKGEVTINRLKNRLTVSVVQEALFDSGRADLHENGKKVLEKVARALYSVDNRLIMIEGHTDNVPIGPKIADKFPTNWELSAARATTVARFLQEKGVDPRHLGATGFSEYRPVASNITEESRQKNRRIDIVLAPEITEEKGSISQTP